MSRAIDADALRDRLQNLGYDDWNQGVTTTWAEAFSECADMVEEMPTIEPRKKGMWLFKERREPVYDISGVKTWGIAYMCSECGFIHTVIEDFGQYVYCPNCGAEMTEGEGCQNT